MRIIKSEEEKEMEITAQYDGRKKEFYILGGKETIVFTSWREFEKHCLNNSVIPIIICYNSSAVDMKVIREKKSQLVEAINSK